MGYYTNYELEVSKGNDALVEELRNENENAEYAFNEFGSSNDGLKWYSHEEDLKNFSCKHPSVLFTLKGEGEENGDIWIKYFLCGKMQKCNASISFEPFNEDLLR